MSGKDESAAPTERSAAVKRLFAVVSERHTPRQDDGAAAPEDSAKPKASVTKLRSRKGRRGTLKK